MKLFSLIEDGEIHVDTDSKILPAEAFGELLDAGAVLEKAKKDAETYHKKNLKRGAELRAKAKEEGFQEGLQQVNQQILALDNKVKEVHHEMNKTVLPLALTAAKKILGRELELRPEAIVDIVLQALKPVKEAQRIKIFVNKDERELVEDKKEAIRKTLEQVEMFAIEERSDVTPGGCIIETEGGIINATLENQWRALEAAFENYLKKQ